MSELRVEVAEAIEQIGPELWPPVAEPASMYLSYPWLRSVEGVLCNRAFYLTLWRSGGRRPLAALPCSLIEDPATYVYFNPGRLLLDPDAGARLASFLPPDLAERWLRRSQSLRHEDRFGWPALLAVAPYGYVSGVCWAAEVAPDERRRLLDPLLRAFDGLASEVGAATRAFWYVHAGATPELESRLRACGYGAVTLAAECRLEVRWPSFPAYLAAVPAAGRKSARQEIRRFERSGLQLSLEGPESLNEELAMLQSSHRRRYGHHGRLDRILLGFRRATENLGPYIRVFVARRSGIAAGFVLAYEHGDTLYCKQGGFDRPAGDFIYFNLAFYGPIRHAVESRLRFVSYGLEAYEAKLRRGCGMVPVLGYLAPGGEEALEHLALHDRAQRAAMSWLSARYAALT